jgi:DNA polymerase kappa
MYVHAHLEFIHPAIIIHSNLLLLFLATPANGQKLVGAEHSEVIQFLHPLPTRKVSGIGRVTEKILQSFGIETVAQLYEKRALVRFLFQTATSQFLLRVAVGCASSSSTGTEDVEEDTAGQKGISRERTFSPEESWKEINIKLDNVAYMLSDDMKRRHLWARTITGKIQLPLLRCQFLAFELTSAND